MKYCFSVFYFAEFQAPSVFKKYCPVILFLLLLLTQSSFAETPKTLSGIATVAIGDSLNLVKILTRENGKLKYAAGVGDVNNDGYADFIATDYISTDLYLGNPQFAFSSAYRLNGGYFLPAGDVNNDGYDDLLQVIPDSIATVYFRMHLSIFYGGVNPGNRVEFLYTLPWRTQGEYLMKLQKIGDINGDGYDDIIFSNCVNAQNDGMGYVYIFFGAETISGTPSAILHSARFAQFDWFGYAICGISDINKDGYDDFLLSAPSGYPVTDTSKVYLYYGGIQFDTIPDFIFRPDTEWLHGRFRQLSYAGDVNKDKKPDFLMGNINHFDTYLYTELINPLLFNSFDQFNGSNLGTGGDINNDGYDDFMLANDNFLDDRGIRGGTAKIFFGEQFIDNSYDYIIHGDHPYARFGYYLSIFGDYNGDGYDDVMIGEPESPNTSRLYIYSYPDVNGTEGQIEPLSFNVAQNYPNPFNPETTIEYSIVQNGNTSLKIYDIHGREVDTIFDRDETKGKHSVLYNAKNLSSGVYLCVLRSARFSKSVKMILVK